MAIWHTMTALPKTCDSGSQKYWRLSKSRIWRVSTENPRYVQPPWRSSTPLGMPVVPEV